MSSNRTTLAQAGDMTPKQIADLPTDMIALLLEDVSALKVEAKRLDDLFGSALAIRYAEKADALRKAQGKDSGTVTIADGDFAVKADAPRKVEWNQSLLRAAMETVKGWGEDPAQYLTSVLSVPESRYSAWPDSIRKVFEPARTVSTGKASFKLEKAKTGSRRAA